MRIPKIIFASLAIVLLCICSAAIAHADTITFTGSRDFFPPQLPAAPNPGRCGAGPPNLLATHTGTGASNLGSFTSTESHCVNVATGNLFNGQFTFDFGEGNTLFGTYVGTIGLPLPPPTGIANVSFTYTLTGGAGIFTQASGSLTGIGTVTFNPTAQASHIEITGTVNTIPEPTTLFLLGTGLAGLGAAVRKRVKRRREPPIC